MTAITIDQVRLTPYRLPAHHGTSNQRRQGLWLELRSSDGALGRGDAAPLMGFSEETVEQATSALESLEPAFRALRSLGWQALDALDEHNLPGTALFAAEQALLALWASSLQVHPASLLATRYDREPRPRLGCQALVADAEEAQGCVSRGFGRLKLKVARQSIAHDLERLVRVRQAVGDQIELVLDANGLWSLDQASEALERFSPIAPVLVEQPLHVDAPWEQMAKLRAGSGIPLALDESIRDMVSLEAAVSARAMDVIVLKPMFCGGLLASVALAQRAAAAEIPLVVTSVLESAVGCAGAAVAAAALPGQLLACGVTSADMCYDPGPWIELQDPAPWKAMLER